MPIRQLGFWLYTEHNKYLCLPSGYGEILLEAGKGIHFTLNALWEQQTEALTVVAGRDLGVSGYFQGESAAKQRGEMKGSEMGEGITEKDYSNNHTYYMSYTKDAVPHWANECTFKNAWNVSFIPWNGV